METLIVGAAGTLGLIAAGFLFGFRRDAPLDEAAARAALAYAFPAVVIDAAAMGQSAGLLRGADGALYVVRGVGDDLAARRLGPGCVQRAGAETARISALDFGFPETLVHAAAPALDAVLRELAA